jgi:hypothetical protein
VGKTVTENPATQTFFSKRPQQFEIVAQRFASLYIAPPRTKLEFRQLMNPTVGAGLPVACHNRITLPKL